MGFTEMAAVLYALVIAIVVIFQFCLIMGAPWGKITQGGRNEATTEFHESYKTEDLLSTNIKTLHIGISVRETYPIESNYLIQAKN
tara:strand:- start:47 stop:304 length:258 start_codon:yes stop_codon:yes gene_type:complete